MANYYNDFVTKLDKCLHEKNRLTDVLEKVEKTTGVKRVYIAQGILGFISLYMIVGYFAELVCNMVGFLYPAYASIHALESPHKDDDSKWLTYWVVFALFGVIEFFSDIIFSWFPLYWLVKVIFLMWCFLPIANNGSNYIYSRFIRPVFLKNRKNINEALSSAASKASDLAGKAFNEGRKNE